MIFEKAFYHSGIYTFQINLSRKFGNRHKKENKRFKMIYYLKNKNNQESGDHKKCWKENLLS